MVHVIAFNFHNSLLVANNIIRFHIWGNWYKVILNVYCNWTKIIFKILYKWNPTVCTFVSGFFWAFFEDSFILLNISAVCFFYCWVVVPCMPQLVYAFISSSGRFFIWQFMLHILLSLICKWCANMIISVCIIGWRVEMLGCFR